jgi:hypothetical protein
MMAVPVPILVYFLQALILLTLCPIIFCMDTHGPISKSAIPAPSNQPILYDYIPFKLNYQVFTIQLNRNPSCVFINVLPLSHGPLDESSGGFECAASESTAIEPASIVIPIKCVSMSISLFTDVHLTDSTKMQSFLAECVHEDSTKSCYYVSVLYQEHCLSLQSTFMFINNFIIRNCYRVNAALVAMLIESNLYFYRIESTGQLIQPAIPYVTNMPIGAFLPLVEGKFLFASRGMLFYGNMTIKQQHAENASTINFHTDCLLPFSGPPFYRIEKVMDKPGFYVAKAVNNEYLIVLCYGDTLIVVAHHHSPLNSLKRDSNSSASDSFNGKNTTAATRSMSDESRDNGFGCPSEECSNQISAYDDECQPFEPLNLFRNILENSKPLGNSRYAAGSICDAPLIGQGKVFVETACGFLLQRKKLPITTVVTLKDLECNILDYAAHIEESLFFYNDVNRQSPFLLRLLAGTQTSSIENNRLVVAAAQQAIQRFFSLLRSCPLIQQDALSKYTNCPLAQPNMPNLPSSLWPFVIALPSFYGPALTPSSAPLFYRLLKLVGGLLSAAK